MKSCKDNMPRKGVFRLSENTPPPVEVNANTVVRTYDYLQGQEIIYNKRGIGYFVSAGAKDRIITLRKDIFLHEELPEFFRQVSALDIPIKEIEKMYKEYLTQQ